MHYLVDAYNLLFRTLKNRGSLEKSRQLLIEELNEMASQLKLHVTLVFDGAEKHIPTATRGHFDSLEIVYTTKAQTADQYIFEEVISSRAASQLTVVTNDRELSGRCHQHRSKTMLIDEFLQFLSKKKIKKKRLGAPPHRSFKDSDPEIARLLIIFEKKMLEELKDQ